MTFAGKQGQKTKHTPRPCRARFPSRGSSCGRHSSGDDGKSYKWALDADALSCLGLLMCEVHVGHGAVIPSDGSVDIPAGRDALAHKTEAGRRGNEGVCGRSTGDSRLGSTLHYSVVRFGACSYTGTLAHACCRSRAQAGVRRTAFCMSSRSPSQRSCPPRLWCPSGMPAGSAAVAGHLSVRV